MHYDETCGIEEPHIHTGIFVENYSVEYFCEVSKWWVTNKECVEEGRLHNRCRIQHTITEEIEIDPEKIALWSTTNPAIPMTVKHISLGESIVPEIEDEVVKYLKDEMNKMLLEELEKQPWWCLLCGEGGNYEGERPDLYWFPPKDHKCKLDDKPGPVGIKHVHTDETGLHYFTDVNNNIRERFDVI